MEPKHLKIFLPTLAVISVLTGGLLVYLFVGFNPVTTESLRNDGFYVYDEPIEIPDFSLVDQHGEAFTRDAFDNKWTLVFFGYTFCPDICPLTMASLKQFYDLLAAEHEADNVQVVMVSVDPKRDTPDVLANYVEFFNPGFIGVTGEYTDIYTFARQMNVSFTYSRVDDEHYLVNHSGEVMLLDPKGANVGFFKPPHDPQLMMENFSAVKSYLEEN